MRLVVASAAVALAAFAAIALPASLLAWLAARRLALAREAGAANLFALRTLPAALGLAGTLGLAVPAFVRFEPRQVAEGPGLTFVLLALAGAALLGRGLLRAVAGAWATGRLRRAWMAAARPVALPGAPVPAYRLRHGFPVVSVLGVLRPRLFVAEQVLDSLSAAELSAVLAHEAAHVAARDNLRRLLLQLCPAPPWGSGLLERGWERAAEEAADASTPERLDLATALVKTARLAPPGARLDVPAAALHRGGALARRVIRLTAEGAKGAAPDRRPGKLARAVLLAGLGAWLGLCAQALPSVHRLVEGLVHLP
jgi:hypothetical protein